MKNQYIQARFFDNIIEHLIHIIFPRVFFANDQLYNFYITNSAPKYIMITIFFKRNILCFIFHNTVTIISTPRFKNIQPNLINSFELTLSINLSTHFNQAELFALDKKINPGHPWIDIVNPPLNFEINFMWDYYANRKAMHSFPVAFLSTNIWWRINVRSLRNWIWMS